MKVLLDEDVPHVFRNELPGHDVYTVSYAGWSGVRNGALLGLAEAAGFDALVTFDRNIQYQQNVQMLGLAIVILAVQDTRLPNILPLLSDLRDALAAEPPPGTLTIVGSWRV